MLVFGVCFILYVLKFSGVNGLRTLILEIKFYLKFQRKVKFEWVKLKFNSYW